MSNNRPADHTTTYVNVRTVRLAKVRATAHYRTTNTTHHATANSQGRASIAFRISRATPGFRVRVDVRVTSGTRAGSCSTSFTPHR